jgi:hypothetical protein
MEGASMRAVAALIALFLSAVPAAANDRCPDPMSGSMRVGRYDFEFQSWIGDQNLAVKCVRNKITSLSPLFVDWDGMVTFVPVNDVNLVRNPATSAKHKTVRWPLWYGARPAREDVDTIVWDEQAFLGAPPGRRSPGLRVADLSFVQAAGVLPPFPEAISSYSRISVPVAAYGPNFRQADIIRNVESNPSILRTFEMAFKSEPLADAAGNVTGVRDHCTYSLTGRGKEKKSLSLRFSDKALQQEVFRSFHPHALSQDQWTPTGPGEARASSGGTRELVNVGAGQLRRMQADMQVVSSGGSVLASVPIIYYSVEAGARP